MITNIGKIDRALRLIAAAVIAVLYFNKTITGTLGIVLMAVGTVLLLTSLVRLCPLYLPFGIRTNKGGVDSCCTK